MKQTLAPSLLKNAVFLLAGIEYALGMLPFWAPKRLSSLQSRRRKPAIEILMSDSCHSSAAASCPLPTLTKIGSGPSLRYPVFEKQSLVTLSGDLHLSVGCAAADSTGERGPVCLSKFCPTPFQECCRGQEYAHHATGGLFDGLPLGAGAVMECHMRLPIDPSDHRELRRAA